ncbi:MAG: VanW family protein, partial [Acidobacteriota bacterium]
VDFLTLEQDIAAALTRADKRLIDLIAISTPPAVLKDEVGSAKQYAEQLMRDGLRLTFEDQEFIMKPFAIGRIITFVEQTAPSRPGNSILGVQFKSEELTKYLETTIAPEINQEAINARFEIEIEEETPQQRGAIQEPTSLTGTRVSQFALPQQGQQLALDTSVERISATLAAQQSSAALQVDVTEPEFADVADIRTLGVTSRLAVGESNFAGSPRNRIHNIHVGANKYHGLLIAPGEEFSFNTFLGPVTAEAGFLPELVIKENVTVSEFGGGLCQVSTTAFRAAVHSGLEIIQRRNHSYAVSYYGTPGFDATIYPPYTDFRFLNNTSGHILIQTKVVGTNLFFEFWGADDGRVVEVDGPHPYNRQPDGAVKAVLTQKVIKDGNVMLEDTFYSNYKSPKLFPKVTAANGEPSE